MSKLLIYKKGSTLKPLLIGGVIFVVVGIIVLSLSGWKHGYGNSEFEDLLQNCAPILMMLGGVAWYRWRP